MIPCKINITHRMGLQAVPRIQSLGGVGRKIATGACLITSLPILHHQLVLIPNTKWATLQKEWPIHSSRQKNLTKKRRSRETQLGKGKLWRP